MKDNFFIEQEFVVDYDYQPCEPPTREHPGCDAEITINSVMLGKVDILPEMSEEEVQAIRETCLEMQFGGLD